METYCERSVHFVAITITERFEARTVGGPGSNRRIADRQGHSTAMQPIPAPLLVALGAMALALVRVPRLRALARLATANLLPRRGSRARLPAGSHQQRALPPP
jgi:hypothetical protein